MRKTELLSLHRSQVDFKRDRIILTHTKNGKARSIPISGKSCGDTAMKPGNPVIFSSLLENPVDRYPILRTPGGTAVKLAGIEYINFHCVGRHTFGTRAAAGGANIADIQEIMDHGVKTTMRYIHATEAGKRAAINAAVRNLSGTNVAQLKKATG